MNATATWRGRSAEAALPVLVLDPAATLAVVSDLDDTVIESGMTRGLEVLRLTLLTEVTKRTPLPGAAELYRALSAPRAGGSVPVFYLSTSPWNLYEVLARFLRPARVPGRASAAHGLGAEPDEPVPGDR